MGLIQDWVSKLKEKKAQVKDFETQRHIEERYEERKLSANERELLRWREKKRQAAIKKALDRVRKVEQHELWRGKTGNPLYNKNIIKDDKKQLKSKNQFLHKDSVLKTRNILKGTKRVY